MQIKQIIVPNIAIMHHINIFICQPKFLESIAIPKVEMPLPTYAQAFKTPVTVETLPYFLKNGGTIAVSIDETPCIAPVSIAEHKTEAIALAPEQK